MEKQANDEDISMCVDIAINHNTIVGVHKCITHNCKKTNWKHHTTSSDGRSMILLFGICVCVCAFVWLVETR